MNGLQLLNQIQQQISSRRRYIAARPTKARITQWVRRSKIRVIVPVEELSDERQAAIARDALLVLGAHQNSVGQAVLQALWQLFENDAWTLLWPQRSAQSTFFDYCDTFIGFAWDKNREYFVGLVRATERLLAEVNARAVMGNAIRHPETNERLTAQWFLENGSPSKMREFTHWAMSADGEERDRRIQAIAADKRDTLHAKRSGDEPQTEAPEIRIESQGGRYQVVLDMSPATFEVFRRLNRRLIEFPLSV